MRDFVYNPSSDQAELDRKIEYITFVEYSSFSSAHMICIQYQLLAGVSIIGYPLVLIIDNVYRVEATPLCVTTSLNLSPYDLS